MPFESDEIKMTVANIGYCRLNTKVMSASKTHIMLAAEAVATISEDPVSIFFVLTVPLVEGYKV